MEDQPKKKPPKKKVRHLKVGITIGGLNYPKGIQVSDVLLRLFKEQGINIDNFSK